VKHFLVNNNFLKRKKAKLSYTKNIQKRQPHQKRLETKKLTRSKRFKEEKVGTLTTTPSKKGKREARRNGKDHKERAKS
jgi:hypothetical protein